MKAITVMQPWAWAVMAGGKIVENRRQRWSYRGPLAIHAGKAWSQRGGSNLLVREAFRAFDGGYSGPGLPEWLFAAAAQEGNLAGARGVLLGVVDLVDVHISDGCCAPWGEDATSSGAPICHLVLDRPRLLAQPVPCRGAQGLWSTPEDAGRELEALR